MRRRWSSRCWKLRCSSPRRWSFTSDSRHLGSSCLGQQLPGADWGLPHSQRACFANGYCGGLRRLASQNSLHFPSLSSAEPLLAGSKALTAILICRAPIGWGKEGQGQKGWLPFSLPDREGRQCLYSRILRWAGGLRVQLARLAALYSPVVRWAGAQSPVSCGGWKRRQAIYNVLRGVLQPFVPRMFNPQPSQPSLSL